MKTSIFFLSLLGAAPASASSGTRATPRTPVARALAAPAPAPRTRSVAVPNAALVLNPIQPALSSGSLARPRTLIAPSAQPAKASVKEAPDAWNAARSLGGANADVASQTALAVMDGADARAARPEPIVAPESGSTPSTGLVKTQSIASPPRRIKYRSAAVLAAVPAAKAGHTLLEVLGSFVLPSAIIVGSIVLIGLAVREARSRGEKIGLVAWHTLCVGGPAAYTLIAGNFTAAGYFWLPAIGAIFSVLVIAKMKDPDGGDGGWGPGFTIGTDGKAHFGWTKKF